jgi:hypothetical protein
MRVRRRGANLEIIPTKQTSWFKFMQRRNYNKGENYKKLRRGKPAERIMNQLPHAVSNWVIMEVGKGADRKLLISQRSQKVADYKGYYHTGSAGYYDIVKTEKGTHSEHPVRGVLREIVEETNLAPKDRFLYDMVKDIRVTKKRLNPETGQAEKVSKTVAEWTQEGEMRRVGISFMGPGLKDQPLEWRVGNIKDTGIRQEPKAMMYMMDKNAANPFYVYGVRIDASEN